jgi:hypothetical protein
MRFHTILEEQVTRIVRAAKRLLDPHRLLPITILLGDQNDHPILSPPVPFHPIPYARRQSLKTGLLFTTPPTFSSFPPQKTYQKILQKFISKPFTSINIDVVRKCKGGFPHTFQLILLNGLFIDARVHHFWPDFPHTHHCRLCGKDQGDNWAHILTQCRSILFITDLLRNLDPSLKHDFSHSLNDALMASHPLTPDQIFNRLVLIHTIWLLRYLSSITQSRPSFALALFWAQRAKAEKQGLLKQIKKAFLS